MRYTLNETKNNSTWSAVKHFLPLLKDERLNLFVAFIALFINTATSLATPIIVGIAINTAIAHRDYHGVLVYSGELLILYIVGFISSYFQTKIMGTVGQRLLFTLRKSVFNKLQELPVAFFNQNKAGDLISRINNDTDRLNDFFSRALMQFVGSIVMMIGTAILIVFLDIRLGAISLAPALVLVIITYLLSPWIKSRNSLNLKAIGGMSAEIQESLDNFKVVVAFNRRDYFRKRFQSVNNENYQSAVSAGIANTIFTPIYGLAANCAQIIVLTYGIYLISQGQFTIGFLISYFVYLSRFYDPIRHIAGLWSTFQVALAGWNRISDVLSLKSDMKLVSSEKTSKGVMAFEDVSFAYDGRTVLDKINFVLESGKTYALVGPTGGGKTTTASLMARLYDPNHGSIFLDGHDIRTYSEEERAKKIGFILQEPFLFTGTVRDTIVYSNPTLQKLTDHELQKLIKEQGLSEMIDMFDEGLKTKISSSGESISLGQRQLLAFIRAVLRKPEILILDEATANVDTLTEKMLSQILDKLPEKTTKVIIAHRLNTIENADEIFFVNNGEIIKAGSLKHAISLLLKGNRVS